MTHYGVITDYEYSSTHKRERLTIWSGAFASVREGEAYSLPKGNGYMVTLEYGDKVRVSCPSPRTSDNWLEVDQAINAALNAHYDMPYLTRGESSAECLDAGLVCSIDQRNGRCTECGTSENLP